jgi:hypothetical protein
LIVAGVASVATGGGDVAMRRLTPDDAGWAAGLLARRRARLVPYAPVYWRPARDADAAHRRFLAYVLGKGGGIGFRTDDSLMIAAPGRESWTVDDAVVADGAWADTGQHLYDALAQEIAGSTIRFVCPAPEPERSQFAHAQGLQLQSSWWQLTVDQIQPSPGDHEQPRISGATASLVRAPQIYDPGGPILFLTGITDARRALPLAPAEAARLGSPVIVVDQRPDDQDLRSNLDNARYYRHCDFYAGTIRGPS